MMLLLVVHAQETELKTGLASDAHGEWSILFSSLCRCRRCRRSWIGCAHACWNSSTSRCTHKHKHDQLAHTLTPLQPQLQRTRDTNETQIETNLAKVRTSWTIIAACKSVLDAEDGGLTGLLVPVQKLRLAPMTSSVHLIRPENVGSNHCGEPSTSDTTCHIPIAFYIPSFILGP